MEQFSLIYINYDDFYSSQFCGSRAADFAALASDLVCVPISLRDVQYEFNITDQIFRRVLRQAYSTGNSSSRHLLLLLDAGGSDAEYLIKKVEDFFQNHEFNAQVTLQRTI